MQNKAIKALSVVFAVLLLVGMGVCVYCIAMNSANSINVAEAIGLAVTAAFAIYYILAGCKKGEGSTYFRWFVNMFALVEVLPMILHEDMLISSVLSLAIAFGCLTVLSVAKDYGQKKSTLLTFVVIAATLIDLLSSLNSSANVLLMIGVHLLLAVTTLFMVCAKYADKKSRGSH